MILNVGSNMFLIDNSKILHLKKENNNVNIEYVFKLHYQMMKLK